MRKKLLEPKRVREYLKKRNQTEAYKKLYRKHMNLVARYNTAVERVKRLSEKSKVKVVKCNMCKQDMIPIAEQRELFPDYKVKNKWVIYRCDNCNNEVEIKK